MMRHYGEAVFQHFQDEADGKLGAVRVYALRQRFDALSIDAFLVPRADEHQGEYVPPCAARLAWLSGFTGSAGLAVVMRDTAAIFIDGRYTLQVRDQVDMAVFTPVSTVETSPEEWLAGHLAPGSRLGYDPWLITAPGLERLEKAFRSRNIALVSLDANPIDAIWQDRPAPPAAKVYHHAVALAGEAMPEKLKRVRSAMAEARLDRLVLSDPHNLCWLFNVRGNDLPYSPLVLGYALVSAEGEPVIWRDGDDQALAEQAKLRPRAALTGDLAACVKGKRVGLDAATAGVALSFLVKAAGGEAVVMNDPIARLKAVKNAVEIAGARSAHRRDGAAVVRFLHYFEREAPTERLTEIDAVCELEGQRRAANELMDISFPTISGAGSNGAIVHYRVSRESNRPIRKGELFLLDSGGQYRDGTTDITRTMAVGEVNDEMKDRFTRVLRGHIAIATAVFPKGTTGAQIDAFARAPLWEIGLDFDHGTGHGVGSFLSVHEGPQRIAKTGHVPLEAGMMLSNEPGYYKTGAYGIRIENLILVEPREITGQDRPYLGFETLTLAPIDLSLVVPALMLKRELDWLNAYHAKVRDALGPLLSEEDKAWLIKATRPVG